MITAEVDPWPRGSLLAKFSPAARSDILTRGTLVNYAAGERFIHQGERTSNVFLIVNGVAKVTADSANGGSTLLAVRVFGDAVGELAALDGEPRIAHVTAAGPLQARRLQRAEFTAFREAHPDAALVVEVSVTQKFRSATRWRIDVRNRVAVRLAHVMGELADRYGRKVPEGIDLGFDMSQSELAALISSSEPSVERVLRELRRRGIIATGYRSFIVIDPVGLAAYAESADPG